MGADTDLFVVVESEVTCEAHVTDLKEKKS